MDAGIFCARVLELWFCPTEFKDSVGQNQYVPLRAPTGWDLLCGSALLMRAQANADNLSSA